MAGARYFPHRENSTVIQKHKKRDPLGSHSL
jgi:hypothetical protein